MKRSDGIDVVRMLEALQGGGQRPQSPEERLIQAKQSFEQMLDQIEHGCEDPRHHPVEDAALAMVSGMYMKGILPDAIHEAVLRTLVRLALHGDDVADGMRRLLSDGTIADAMLVAGAVLRATSKPTVAAIPAGTGVYL